MKNGTAKNAEQFAGFLLDELAQLVTDELDSEENRKTIVVQRLRDLLGNGLVTDPRYADETNVVLVKTYKKLMGIKE